ncbi:MAG: TetR/AcrR family transcriptional regulator [Pseudonocardia sp.]
MGRSGPRATKRDLIVEEAARLFYERGTGLGVDTLVDEIGVAKMTLYKHFPTKADLVVACLRHVDQRYRDRLVDGTREACSPQERILGIFDSLHDWFGTPSFRGCAFVNATVELADPAHPARAAVHEHKARTREWVAEIVAETGVADPAFVARQIVQLMEGAITTALVEQDPTAALVARATAGQVLDAAVRPAPGPPAPLPTNGPDGT